MSAAIAAGLDAADYKLDTERFDRGGAVGRGADGRDVPGDISGTTSDRNEGSLLRLLLLVALGLVAGIGLLKLALRKARFLTRDPRKIAAACRRELGEFLADQKIDGAGECDDSPSSARSCGSRSRTTSCRSSTR